MFLFFLLHLHAATTLDARKRADGERLLAEPGVELRPSARVAHIRTARDEGALDAHLRLLLLLTLIASSSGDATLLCGGRCCWRVAVGAYGERVVDEVLDAEAVAVEYVLELVRTPLVVLAVRGREEVDEAMIAGGEHVVEERVVVAVAVLVELAVERVQRELDKAMTAQRDCVVERAQAVGVRLAEQVALLEQQARHADRHRLVVDQREHDEQRHSVEHRQRGEHRRLLCLLLLLLLLMLLLLLICLMARLLLIISRRRLLLFLLLLLLLFVVIAHKTVDALLFDELTSVVVHATTHQHFDRLDSHRLFVFLLLLCLPSLAAHLGSCLVC